MSEPTPAPGSDPRLAGPLDRTTAQALIRDAEQAAQVGDFSRAGALYGRVVGASDPLLHITALLGLADAHYRLDNEAAAVATWEMATRGPETPLAWRAWKQLAAARVRDGNLRGAIEAYRQAERRAPPDERPEIASRLGWLNKETGNARAAQGYFARARPASETPVVSYILLSLTIGIGVAQLLAPPGQDLWANALSLDKAAVAAGQWWRLVTVVLVHAGALHLAFNMYFLYLIGPVVEGLFGRWRFLLLYILTAAAASTLSFVLEPGDSVGASGALFGLAGVLAVTMRVYKPMLGRQARALAGQIVFLIVLNLVFDVGVVGGGLLNIDIFAHIGGLIGGAWLGLVIPPLAPTLRTAFVRPGDRAPSAIGSASILQTAGVLALVGVIAAGVAIGTPLRSAQAAHAAGAPVPAAIGLGR